MSFEYVRADVLRNVQRRLIDSYGGVAGVRDDGGLESAIARPRNLAEYGRVTSAAALAGALAWGVVRNHPFVDGNKRAAFAGMSIFLEINGYRLSCSEAEETAMILRIAAGTMPEEDWTAWCERAIEKKP
jgi:death on curing protein